MPEGNNIKIIDACIQEFRDANQLSLSEGDIFELFVGLQVTKDQDLSADDVRSAVVDGPSDGGVDLFLVTLDDQPLVTVEDANEAAPTKQSHLRILVAQTKHETSFRESVLDKWITSMQAILDLSLTEEKLSARFNPSLTEKIVAFKQILVRVLTKGGTASIRYVYASRANEYVVSPAFTSKLQQLLELSRSALASADVSAECLSARELFRLYQTEAPERRALSFSGNPLAVRYEEGIGYLGLAHLRELKKFMTAESGQVEERVFESNVRHFQGSTDVNGKIQETVRSDKSRDFWWLNNGVTIVAPAATPLGNSLTITSPQIVNGLQTSFAIFESLEDETTDDRCVLVKVIVSSDKSTIDKVISATNSQTAVSAASLRATDEIQRQLEAYFESCGYFYDRRKNYHKNRGKPLARIFATTFVAQSIHAVLNKEPSGARARPTTLIKDDPTYASIFDPRREFQAYLNSCLIVQESKSYVAGLSASHAKTILANYVFHLAQVATAFAIGNLHYTDRPVSTLAIARVAAATPKAADWLHSFISRYLEENPTANFITLSKSRPFAEQINIALHGYLTTSIHDSG